MIVALSTRVALPFAEGSLSDAPTHVRPRVTFFFGARLVVDPVFLGSGLRNRCPEQSASGTLPEFLLLSEADGLTGT